MNKGLIDIFRRSITVKIFLITLTLLLISATLIYSMLYFFLPNFYQKYKIDQLNTRVGLLAKDIQNLSLENAKALIDEAAQQTNSLFILSDNTGKIVYVSSIHSSTGIITSIDTNYTAKTKSSSGPHVWSGSVIDPNSQAAGISSTDPLSRFYDLTISVTLEDRILTLNVNTALQPINEAAKVLGLYIPYIGAFILLISGIGAYVYSRIISRPLIRLNQAAKKMAGLEFVPITGFYSKDEIGQLFTSLNEMSVNLHSALSELHTANEQLKNEMIKEREIEDKRRDLFSMISHELKSPLTAVKGQLEGMLLGFGVYKDRDKYLKRSYEIMDEMEKLIYEIIQVAKLEQHTFLPNIETINLTDLVCNAVKKAEFFAAQRSISIITEVLKDIFIESDRKLIEKAVYNIIHNGVIYSEPSEQVIVRMTTNESRLLSLTVLNTGSHIPEAQLEKIFNPFYRLDKSGNKNKGGSGLGLYLVKKIFEVLEVDYSISNEPEGVLFKVVFKQREFIISPD